MAIIDLIIGGAWKYILAGAGALIGLIYVRNSGVQSERRKAAERAAEAMREQREIERYVEGRTPDDVRGDLAKWLRDGDEKL